MRHRKDHRKLSRTHEHRKALLRNLATSLIQHERIETTLVKAKEARRLAERMVTFAKRGDVAARRHVARFIHGDENVRKLFDTIAPWYAERNGGYTRIVRVGRRLGDAGEVALLEFVKTAALKEKLRAEAAEKAKAAKSAKEAAKGAKDAAKGKKAGKAEAAAAAGAGAAAGAPAEAAAPGETKEKAPKKAKPERGGPGGKKVKAPKGPKGGATRARHQGRSGE